MTDPGYQREWARRCRSFAQVTTDPEVKYVLESWATAFDRDADELERRAIERGELGSPD